MVDALTWQQVAAPNFSGSTDALRSAGQLMNTGFGGLSDALSKYTTFQQNQAGAQLLGNLSKYQNTADAKAALANQTALAGVNTGYLTPEAWKAANDQITNLYAQASSAAGTDRTRALIAPEVAQTYSGAHVNDANAALTAAETPGRVAGILATNAETAARTGGLNLQNQITGTNFNNENLGKTVAADAFARHGNVHDALTGALNSPASGSARIAAMGVLGANSPLVYGDQSGQGSGGNGGGVAGAPGTGGGVSMSVPIVTPDGSGGGAGPAPIATPPMARNAPSAPIGSSNVAPGGAVHQRYASALASGDTAGALKEIEGLKTNAYMDVNHYRTGYGSDKITLPDGSTQDVTKDTKITQADAERDLARRITEFGQKASDAVGANWKALNPAAQSALTSMTYNYGHLPNDVAKAASSGDAGAVAQAIAGHAYDNKGVNYARRMAEASAVSGQAAPNPGQAGAPPNASGAIAAAAGAGGPPPPSPLEDPATQLHNAFLASMGRNAQAAATAKQGYAQSMADGTAGTYNESSQDTTTTIEDAVKQLKGEITTKKDADNHDVKINGAGVASASDPTVIQRTLQNILKAGNANGNHLTVAQARDIMVRDGTQSWTLWNKWTGGYQPYDMNETDQNNEINRINSNGPDGRFAQNQENVRTKTALDVSDALRTQTAKAHQDWLDAYNDRQRGRNIDPKEIAQKQAYFQQMQKAFDEATGRLTERGPALQAPSAQPQVRGNPGVSKPAPVPYDKNLSQNGLSWMK